ncbi:transcriptional regulator [Acidianus infernus]|uniref:Transcriptional regulator n=1 Tax=Acidianus infernus TaxID=12915 RepID=A0A6A9QFL3_ACIIN|nr:helix-turn-helix domain-containing protein [Acidianus infernus]MUM65075.1 transcriptional regulator [Acidianus infernus]
MTGCCIQDEQDLCMEYSPKIYQLITRKYTLAILLLLDKYDKMRFNEIMRKINGITQRILSMRLKELEKAYLIRREIDKNGKTVMYSITTQGKALKNAMLMLLQLTNLLSPPNNPEKDYFC